MSLLPTWGPSAEDTTSLEETVGWGPSHCTATTECKGERLFGNKGSWGLSSLLLQTDGDGHGLWERQQQFQYSTSVHLWEEEGRAILPVFSKLTSQVSKSTFTA